MGSIRKMNPTSRLVLSAFNLSVAATSASCRAARSSFLRKVSACSEVFRDIYIGHACGKWWRLWGVRKRAGREAIESESQWERERKREADLLESLLLGFDLRLCLWNLYSWSNTIQSRDFDCYKKASIDVINEVKANRSKQTEKMVAPRLFLWMYQLLTPRLLISSVRFSWPVEQRFTKR